MLTSNFGLRIDKILFIIVLRFFLKVSLIVSLSLLLFQKPLTPGSIILFLLLQKPLAPCIILLFSKLRLPVKMNDQTRKWKEGSGRKKKKKEKKKIPRQCFSYPLLPTVSCVFQAVPEAPTCVYLKQTFHKAKVILTKWGALFYFLFYSILFDCAFDTLVNFMNHWGMSPVVWKMLP